MHFSGKPSSDPDEITFLPPLETISLDLTTTLNITSTSTSTSTRSSSSTISLSSTPPSPPKTKTKSLPPKIHNPPSPRELECTICTNAIGTPFYTNNTPQIEEAVTLPCGHIYGNICIKKWLEKKSVGQNCPDCRRKMVHRGCGHFVEVRRVGRCPGLLVGDGGEGGFGGSYGEGADKKWWNGERGLEGECFRCRGLKVVEEMVRGERERMEMEVKVVKGLWEGLRSVFGMGGGIGGRNGGKIVKERMEERRREFERVWDGAWGVWEREEGMRRW